MIEIKTGRDLIKNHLCTYFYDGPYDYPMLMNSCTRMSKGFINPKILHEVVTEFIEIFSKNDTMTAIKIFEEWNK
jgi:hypothetical protein